MMKTMRIFAVMVVMFFALCAVSFAQTTQVITRDVTVKGDATRGPLVAGLVNAYFADTKATAVVDTSLGEHVMVAGSGGSQSIHFSPKLVARLQKLATNPRASEGLMSVCPTQAGQLQRAIGPMKTVYYDGPQVTLTKDSYGKSKAILEGCKNGSCWTRNPMGTYWNLGNLAGISVVGNINNTRYAENTVSAKMQVEGGKWVKKTVVRNQTMSANAMLSLSGLQTEMFQHFAQIEPLTVGKVGGEGDSCFERTWKVKEDGTYFVLVP